MRSHRQVHRPLPRPQYGHYANHLHRPPHPHPLLFPEECLPTTCLCVVFRVRGRCDVFKSISVLIMGILCQRCVVAGKASFSQS